MLDSEDSIFSEDEWVRVSEALRLSRRETDLVRCLFRGLSDKQIAGDLGITVGTIRGYMSKLFLKLGASDRVEVVLCVLWQFLDKCRRENCPRILNRLS